MIIPLRTLAAELGVTPSAARKIALRLGHRPVRRQLRSLGHAQRTLCWTREQADAIKRWREEHGFEVRQ